MWGCTTLPKPTHIPIHWVVSPSMMWAFHHIPPYHSLGDVVLFIYVFDTTGLSHDRLYCLYLSVTIPKVDGIVVVLGCFVRWLFELMFSKPAWAWIATAHWQRILTIPINAATNYLRRKLRRCFQPVCSFPTVGSPHKDGTALKSINPTDIDQGWSTIL